MTSTTETETKVETTQAPTKEETLPANNETVDAVKEADKPVENASAPGSPTKKTGTLKNVVTVHKKEFEKDIVYLYQFVRTPTIPSLSACCLRVETFLRVNGIQYENIDHKLRFKSKKGQLPFIEINGKEVEDPDLIIRDLSNFFNKDLEQGLTEEQKTVSHAFESMLNNHTGWIVRWWRYNNPQEFLDTAQLDIKRTFNSRFPNSILNFVFKIGFRKHLKDAVGFGQGKFSTEEVLESAKSDLKALSNLLGSQDYFFGKDPHSLDITAFAHLAQFFFVPFGGLKEWMETETPNLVALVERFKTNNWSDWDEIGTSLDMNTHLPKKEVSPDSNEAKPDADAKKAKEEKAAEKKRLAEEKKKEREEKKKKDKEEKERKKKEKEEADKAAKEKAAAEEAAKQEQAKTEQANENAAPAAAEAPAETKEAEKQESAPNGAPDAAKPEVATE